MREREDAECVFISLGTRTHQNVKAHQVLKLSVLLFPSGEGSKS
jgi:hypothetical protein